MSLVNKYRKLSNFEKKILIDTYLTSIKVRYYIKFFKMPYYVKLLGSKGEKSANVDFDTTQKDIIIKNVKRVSRYSFWRTKCFEEAFVTKLLLQKYDIQSTIYFGVKKNETSTLDAHSWLKIGDNCIIGCGGIDKYTITEYFT